MDLLRAFRSGTKLLIAAALYYSGLLGLYLHRRGSEHGLVLLYHRVLPADEASQSCSSDAIIVTPATFARHLRALRHHFELVGPDEFEQWFQGMRRFEKPPCLVTFDDGWKDNRIHALPVLRSEAVPAVIFLPTDFVGTGHVFWQERLTAMLEALGRHPQLREHPLVVRLGLEAVFERDSALRSRRARDAARRFKSRTPDQIDSVLADVTDLIQSAVGPVSPVAVDAHLDWQDVHEMQRNGVEFGSHAVTHRILTQLGEDAVHRELSASKQTLERNLRKPVRILAYPNGDHDANTCRIAEQAGYALAFTTAPGWVKRGQDPYRLRRINIHEGAHRYTPAFYAAILGVF